MTLLRLLSCLVFLVGVVGSARAQDVTTPSTIEVALVRASREGKGMDDALSGMAKALRALPYDSFTSLELASWPSPTGTAHEHPLPHGLTVQTTVTETTDAGASVLVRVRRGDEEVLTTRFQRPWGLAHVLHVGAEGGGFLLLPVRVRR